MILSNYFLVSIITACLIITAASYVSEIAAGMATPRSNLTETTPIADVLIPPLTPTRPYAAHSSVISRAVYFVVPKVFAFPNLRSNFRRWLVNSFFSENPCSSVFSGLKIHRIRLEVHENVSL